MTEIEVHASKKKGSTAGSPTRRHKDVVRRRRTAGDSDDSCDKEAGRHSASEADGAGQSKAKRATPPLSPDGSEEDIGGHEEHRHPGSASDSEDVKAKHPKTSGHREGVERDFVSAVQNPNAARHSVTEEHAKHATPPLSPSTSEDDDVGEEKKTTHRGSASDSADAKAKHSKATGRREAVESTFVVSAHDANAAGHNATHPRLTNAESALVADDVAKAGTAAVAAAAAAAVAMRLADQRTNDEPDLAQQVKQCSGDPHVACVMVALGIFLVYCLLRN